MLEGQPTDRSLHEAFPLAGSRSACNEAILGHQANEPGGLRCTTRRSLQQTTPMHRPVRKHVRSELYALDTCRPSFRATGDRAEPVILIPNQRASATYRVKQRPTISCCCGRYSAQIGTSDRRSGGTHDKRVLHELGLLNATPTRMALKNILQGNLARSRIVSRRKRGQRRFCSELQICAAAPTVSPRLLASASLARLTRLLTVPKAHPKATAASS